jgi:putative hydrolase of the HAD superfamily
VSARTNGAKSAGKRRFDALLCDLDGVLRIWDPALWPPIEERHRMPPGTIGAAAFAPGLLLPPVLGQVSDEQWRLEVARSLAQQYGIERAAAAVADWSAPTGRVEPIAVALVQQVRAAGIRAVMARIGAVKPDPEIYLHAAQAAGAEPDRCLFVDDTPANVVGAEAVGMTAILYTGTASLPEIATALGLGATPAS